jgi:hypothetical protein
MKLDPNSRIFDRVPALFVSPFPAADAFADDAFQAFIAKTSGEQTVGQALLTQAAGQAWNHATQMMWKAKATQAGDLLADVWSQVSWINEKRDSIAGILAEVPFPLTTDPNALVGAIVNVGLDLALDAVSAVPVVGWVVGIAVGIGRALGPVFAARAVDKNARLPIEILPWRRYSEASDQAFVRAFLDSEAPGADWTNAFAPPTAATPWKLAEGLDPNGTPVGHVVAPFADKKQAVAWSGGGGCLPGTFRVAGILQHRERPQPETAALRFYRDGTLIQRHGDFTQTGDFFPALQQVAGTAWQQVAAGGPDTFKIDTVALTTLWRDWFTALYTSAIEQNLGVWLLQYLAREVHGEWRLGTTAAGVWKPQAVDGTDVPLVTGGVFRHGGLATPRSRTTCLYSDYVKGSARSQAGMPTKWTREGADYIAPSHADFEVSARVQCVPWPPGELLLSTYGRADDRIVIPALKAVAQLQRVRLARSLDAAYVRPEPVGDKPAYAAFRDPELRALALELRKKLLQHPSRMLVEYETAREVDPEYAAALKAAGVPTTPAQRAAALFSIRGEAATAEPLDPKVPAPPPPLPLQGGLPFEPDPRPTRASWLGPAVLGGAALLTAIGVAVGVSRHRRAHAR